MDKKEFFRRRGTFKISWELYRDYPEVVIKLLYNVLIDRIEFDIKADIVIYQGYSEYFDQVENNEPFPEYQVSMSSDDIVTWTRWRNGD